MSVFNKVFTDNDSSLDDFLRDKEVRALIVQQTIKDMREYGGIVPYRPREVLLAVTLDQDFANPKESMYVADMIFNGIRDMIKPPFPLDLPKAEKHEYPSLARRFFTSIVFFRAYYETVSKKREGISVKYLRGVSKALFRRLDRYDIAQHHELWEDHLPRRLKLENGNDC